MIVELICGYIRMVLVKMKFCGFYLLDSVVKNFRGFFVCCFVIGLSDLFLFVYVKVDII